MVTIPAAPVSAFGVQFRLPCEDASCADGSTRFATPEEVRSPANKTVE
jgi:hypothetical protein